MLAAILGIAGVASAASFVVTTVADGGAGSLRQAILDANASPGQDDVVFAIPDGGVPQIIVASALPVISGPVVMDGATQVPGGRVEITGTAATGLSLTGGSSALRNLVINGFTSVGLAISGPGANVVEGCYVGTDLTGAINKSPTAVGIQVSSSAGNRIGGTTPAARNLVSGNAIGVRLTGAATTNNVVMGNFIGTDATGLNALGNVNAGVDAFLSGANTIGGPLAGAGNVIAGNLRDGIALSASSGFVIQGNLIGLAADDTSALPNGTHGVRLLNTTANTVVGGGTPNHIAFNLTNGATVALNAGAGNRIESNAIHDNGLLGIDIGGASPTANDAGDADAGANLLQNYPVLAPGFAGGTTVDGTLDSTANLAVTIQVFANVACDPSGYGEARELVATLPVTTDGTGHAAFTASLSRSVAAGEFLAATAIDAAGNTSELSLCTPAPGPTTTTTTAPPTTTSTSLVAATTTSTSAAPATTTSTTLADSEATTTSTLPPPTTTSTTLDATTTTSTTLETTTTSTTLAESETTTTTTSTTLADPDTTTTSTLPPPSTTSTTLDVATTSTTLDTVTTTSTTLDAVTTTSTTLPDPETTTTSTLPSPTTTSTTLDAGTTTSTTLDAGTTTSTSAAPATTTSTTLPDPDTTTTSTLPPPTTTSTTLDTVTTTSTTLDAGTTTSTSAAPATTTSTTLPDPDTTTTSTLPPPTTTSTTLDAATTTSTTLPPSTSTTVVPSTTTSTSSTSTTQAPGTTTSTSTPASSTTSTTLPDPRCVGDDCPRPCDVDASYASLHCRLGVIDTALTDALTLGTLRGRFDRHMGRAHGRLDRSEGRCRSARQGPARRGLRQFRMRMLALGRVLRSKPVRHTLPPA